MTKRVFLLMGLAILAVVWSHAAGMGQIAMILWADRYRPVSVPNFDQVGTLPYYVLLAIRQLTIWGVPAFLFISGFFMAYAARGSQSALSWKMVRTRLVYLLVPYVIWSAMCFAGDALEGLTYAPREYLERLVFGRAHGSYFYVPLLVQFYLLAPLLAPVARTRGRLLLVVAACLQGSAIGLRYLLLFWIDEADLGPLIHLQAPWLFVIWCFFFVLGFVGGFHLTELKLWLARRKWALLAAMIALAPLAIVEPEMIYLNTGVDRRFVPLTIATNLYSVAFLLCFLAFEISLPFPRGISEVGKRSYAIYLLHLKTMQFFGRVIRQIAPWMLAHQVLLFKPLMFAIGLGVPLLFMALVARLPARRVYRYLFG